MAKVQFVSKFPGYKIYVEETEKQMAGNRIKRDLRKVEFVNGKFETDDPKLIAELREIDGINDHFQEVKDQVPGQAAGAATPKK